MKTLLLILVLLFVIAASAAADNGTGTIEGSVQDLFGRPVAEATVYALNTKVTTNRIIQFTTDSDGGFVLSNLPPGTYEVHAYKESEGYPDTYFSFFATSNKRAWRMVQVSSQRKAKVVLELGPKYARLEIVIKDELNRPAAGSLIFTRLDDAKRPYKIGSSVSGETHVLVPPVAFRLEVAADGYALWQSDVLRPRSDESVPVTVRLKPSHQQLKSSPH